MPKVQAVVTPYRIILRQQLPALFPMRINVRNQETTANEVPIRLFVKEGVMRPAELTYNPEHPFVQRVPCVHAVSPSHQSVIEAFGHVYMWAQRQEGYIQ